MNQAYNWSGFYNALCHHGPDLLVGIDEDLREVIKELSTSTDMFWSEGLEASLAEGAASGALREGVLRALEDWRFNLIDQLDASFGISLDRGQVSIETDSPKIEVLVAGASQT